MIWGWIIAVLKWFFEKPQEPKVDEYANVDGRRKQKP
jgi:hypothetical protein